MAAPDHESPDRPGGPRADADRRPGRVTTVWPAPTDRTGHRSRAPDPNRRRRKDEHWRYDIGERVVANQRIAREAYSRVTCHADYLDPRRRLDPLPKLLDQRYAARERHWVVPQAHRIYRHHRRAARARGVRLRSYATTVTPPRWLVPVEGFDPAAVAAAFAKWRKQAQRWARALPAESFVCGAIDVALVHDQQYDLRYWAFHLHLLILVPARTRRQGRDLIRRAFPIKARERMGVLRPVVSKRLVTWKGGARGWLRYATKSLQIHAVSRRTVPYDAATGKRLEARKGHLSFQELAPWADVLSRVRADDLMVWVGYRRRGQQVVSVTA